MTKIAIPMFRAWDKDYKVMYTNAWPFEDLVHVEVDKTIPTIKNHEYAMRKMGEGEEVNQKWFYPIVAKNVVLMRYSDTLDISDKRGCEGDIIRYSNDVRLIIVYDDGALKVCSYNMLTGRVIASGYLNDLVSNDFEIIGNRLENPDLCRNINITFDD